MDTLEGRAEKEGSLVPSDTIDSLDQYSWLYSKMGFPSGSAGKESTCSSEDTGDVGSIPGLGRFPWRKKHQPTPVFLPEKSHEQRSLAGYSPKGCKELDTTERLSTSTCSNIKWKVCGEHPVYRLESHINSHNSSSIFKLGFPLLTTQKLLKHLHYFHNQK